MRNRIWALLIGLHCFAFVAMAQNPAKRQLVLPLSGGGFVSFRSETSAPAKAAPDGKSLAALLYAQAFSGEDRIIHRVLTDAERRIIFAYDLSVSANPVTKKFRIVVLPADEAFRRSFLKDTAPLKAHESFATFPKSATPQTLDDGDAVSLELLVNRESGVKIIDVVKVTFDRSILRENLFDALPKDFTLEEVSSLSVKSYELTIDGNLVGKSKSKLGCTGSLLWFYVPDRGRFIVSLVPREGYSFQKVGMLDGNRIEFVMNGEYYEWTSSESILPTGGAWHLWVLHDPEYTPLFGAEKPAPKAGPQKGPNIFQKIEEKLLTRQGVSLSVLEPRLGKPGSRNPIIPQRVMIGGSDNMDNLLPQSP